MATISSYYVIPPISRIPSSSEIPEAVSVIHASVMLASVIPEYLYLYV